MKPIVVLDPGHGGYDPGALGPTGLRESDMAWDVCDRAKKLLVNSCKVRLTRTADVFIPLAERAEKANDWGADVFVSVHFNSSVSKAASGFEVYTTRKKNNSDILASAIGKVWELSFTGQKQRRDWADGDLDKEASFAVIRLANCPAALVECEFIHNHAGETMIRKGAVRQKMANTLVEGILLFLREGGKLEKENKVVRSDAAEMPELLSGEEIYNRLVRVSDMQTYLKSLTDKAMRKLMDELELLPNVNGVPGIVAILADEEVARRFKENEK